jgi:predicted peroxiredoxin
MPGKFVVNVTVAKDNRDKATVAFVLANAALASGKDTVVFLASEGVRLSQAGYADDVREEGLPPLADLLASFGAGGGQIFVCSPCFKKRQLEDGALVRGAVVVGGAKLVEFMQDGAPSLSF